MRAPSVSTERSPGAPAAPRVVFVAGWGRSGSTLLDRTLGLLPGVVSVGELRDIWMRGVVEDRRCGCGAPFSGCDFWSAVGHTAFGGWDQLDVDRVIAQRMKLDRPWNYARLRKPAGGFATALAEYASTLATLYRAIQDVSGAAVIVDSSKIATHAMALLAAGVDVSAVHLTRDSRGVIYSWQKSVRRGDARDGEGDDEMLRYSPASGSVRYVMYNAMAESLRRLGVPTVHVRYEDLAADPAATMAVVADHAGLEVPSAIAATLADREIPLRVNHTVDGNPMRFRTGNLSVQADQEWRDRLSPGTRRFVTASTLPLLLRYRYLSPSRAGNQA